MVNIYFGYQANNCQSNNPFSHSFWSHQTHGEKDCKKEFFEKYLNYVGFLHMIFLKKSTFATLMALTANNTLLMTIQDELHNVNTFYKLHVLPLCYKVYHICTGCGHNIIYNIQGGLHEAQGCSQYKVDNFVNSVYTLKTI